MELLYVQSTGLIYQDGVLLAQCYSGNGDGLDNPAKQSIHAVGPLPCGWYTLGHAEQDTHLGPNAIPLIPDATNEMFGRSAFFMHLDNVHHNHSASEGCIVFQNPPALAKLAGLPGTRLQVVATKPEAGKP